MSVKRMTKGTDPRRVHPFEHGTNQRPVRCRFLSWRISRVYNEVFVDRHILYFRFKLLENIGDLAKNFLSEQLASSPNSFFHSDLWIDKFLKHWAVFDFDLLMWHPQNYSHILKTIRKNNPAANPKIASGNFSFKTFSAVRNGSSFIKLPNQTLASSYSSRSPASKGQSRFDKEFQTP